MFTADSRQDGIEVCFQDETIWLTQKLMAELFQCSTDNISLHLKNIFKDGELDEKSVAEESSVTARDGKQYRTKYYNLYNLDAIIAIFIKKQADLIYCDKMNVVIAKKMESLSDG